MITRLTDLFPDPLNAQYYLWAHHWEDLDNGRWSHPGHCTEDAPEHYARGGFTTEEAVEESRKIDNCYLHWIANGEKTCESILWHMVARYRWLVEFGSSRDPADTRDIDAWAQDKIPALPWEVTD